MALIVVDTFTTSTEAEIARVKLHAAGIHSEVVAENFSGWRPEFEATLGVDVRVAPEDADEARRILREVREARGSEDAGD